MHQRTTARSLTSSPTWGGLHDWLREAMQKLPQAALEAEVTELLGRVGYQRRATVDGPGWVVGRLREAPEAADPCGDGDAAAAAGAGLEE